MMKRDYSTLLSIAMEKHCGDGHKTAVVVSNIDGLVLMHGDHQRKIPGAQLESEHAIIAAVSEFIKVCHDYDEGEDER